MIRAIALLTAAILLGDPPSPAGALPCVRPNGKLTLRKTCRRAERPLDATALAPVGPSGAPGAPGKRGEFPLVIVDAGGQEVGSVLSFDLGTALVLVTHPTLASPVRFAVSPTGFGNLGDDAFTTVFYAQPGCTGQPYLPAGLAPYAHVEGTAAYLAAGSSAPLGVLSSETDDFVFCLVFNLTDRGTCCTSQATTETVVPATRIRLGDLGFTAPFRTIPR